MRLSDIFAALPSRALAAREQLFRQGARATAIFHLTTGQVRLVRHLKDGSTATLHCARAGELFAEGALFSSRYRCDAIADVPSEIRAWPKSDALRRIGSDPALGLHVMERIAHQLHVARSMLELRNIRSAEDRVLQHLRLSASNGSDTVEFTRPLTHVAAEIGLRHEAYYRCLATLQDKRAIERRGRSFRLLPGTG